MCAWGLDANWRWEKWMRTLSISFADALNTSVSRCNAGFRSAQVV